MIDLRTQDLELLNKLLGGSAGGEHAVTHDAHDVHGDRDAHEGLSLAELSAFTDMRAGLLEGTWHALTEKQRAWVQRVYERLVPAYTADATKVPRGREVASMVGALPKRPPQPIGRSVPRGISGAARGILDEERGTPFRPDGLDAPPDASREDE